jgi:hypothetical protein
MTEHDLRRVYAALQQERASSAQTCDVTPERMLAAIEGHGSEAERVATIDAALAHPASAHELELLRALAANRRVARRTLPWKTVWLGLAAAAALAIVATPTVRGLFRDGGPQIVRNGTPDAVLLAPPEDAALDASRTFRWRSVPGTRVYSLEILTSEGTLVFTTRTADTTMTLPQDVTLEPGVDHRWWITAELSDGTRRPSAFRRLVVRTPR